MRGNPRNQAGQIFRKLDRIGEKRHLAKQEARADGTKGNHATSKKLGIYSFSTMTAYRRIGTSFLTWCREHYGIKDAAKLQPEHAQEWLQIKIASNVRKKTFSTYASCLTKMSVGLSQIYTKNYDWSTAIDVTRKQARSFCGGKIKCRGYARPEAVIQQLDGDFRLAAELQLFGGARVHEITHIRPDQLRGHNMLLLTNTKGGRRRIMLLPPNIYSQIEAIVNSQCEFRVSYQTYMRRLKSACLEAQQPYTGTHGFRWSFAAQTFIDLQDQGLSYDEALRAVSLKLGHNRPKITEHYLQ